MQSSHILTGKARLKKLYIDFAASSQTNFLAEDTETSPDYFLHCTVLTQSSYLYYLFKSLT